VRWILELNRTVIEAAGMLLVFFVFTTIAYVIVQFAEVKRSREP